MDHANGTGPASAAARAERFEDERRRIIDSCFSRLEDDGSLHETYITHIRVIEYSSIPSTTTPPQARSAEAEKPRIIIVAVRKSGRVRMHKSKENTNGTFSIGKSWNLDDLSHIESFTSLQQPAASRNWAADTGFVVTLGKQYFWKAQTEKEKKFFIASLIKIYGKYTGGRTPGLSGFDQREEEQVLGASRRQAGSHAPSTQTPTPTRQGVTSATSESSQSAAAAQLEISSLRNRTPPGRPRNGSGSPAASFDSSASRERRQPQWMARGNKSQESVGNSTTTRSDDTSGPPRSRNGIAGAGASGRFGEHGERSEPPREPLPTLPQPQPRLGTSSQTQQDGKEPPQRRRPPMDPSRPDDRDLVPPPLMSPPSTRDPSIPPRSASRASPRKDLPGRELAVEHQATSSRQPVITSALTGSESARSETPKLEESANGSNDAQRPGEVSPASKSDATIRSSAPAEPLEEARPGLGPMIKAKRSRGEIAGVFKKAAHAATAFRPRPGGAGERLLQAQNKASDGPDGITSVVPAPPRPVSRDTQMNEGRMAETRNSDVSTPQEPLASSQVPQVKISVPESDRSSGQNVAPKGAKESRDPKSGDDDISTSQPRRSIVEGNDAQYLRSLGVHPSVLDASSSEFSKWLDYFGWVPGSQMRSLNVDDIMVDLEREVNKAQAGGWLARFSEEDERIDAIKQGIDVAMVECEELDNLLTLYAVELSTLSDDIAYIEAQGQGLQVQTANQKLLKAELESLLETCAITATDMDALRMAPLDNLRGLEEVETSLVTLFRAMMKIDPTLGGLEPGKQPDASLNSEQAPGLNSNYSNMRIVQEKKQMYMQENAHFMRKLTGFMTLKFDEAFSETRRALEGALSRKVDAGHHQAGRDVLWQYSPLMLYARDVDLENWNRLIQIYQDKAQPIYQSEFQSVVTVWRRNARKATGDEAELLFSSQVEKHQEGVAMTARRLTVKRSQTLVKSLRSDGGSRINLERSGGDRRSLPYEVFAGAVDDLLPLVEMEQNFIIDFFHASTLEQSDFSDVVAACAPRDRRGGDLRRHRPMEPDRELARRVTRSMEVIFSFLETELQKLMEWVVGQDPLQGIGVLGVLEKKLAAMSQSNQDYLNSLLHKLHSFLEGRFRRFVDEQIRAIEETKVKVNKRRGVISFIRVFPGFSTAVENMVAGLDSNLAVRRLINSEYDRILRSMFESLMVIARENPAVGVASGGADPEDKEALNFHILLIENMNHFLEETDARGLDVLEAWEDRARSEYHEHMALYLSAVMRRPLGKLLDYLENMEAQIQAGKAPASIAGQSSNNRGVFNKVLGNHDAKEVRKGIEALRKRVEKHFGDADDPGLSRDLVTKVTRECEAFYGEVGERIGRLTTDVYGGDVLFEWPRAEVKAAFR